MWQSISTVFSLCRNDGIKEGNADVIPPLFLYSFIFSTLKIRGAVHIEGMTDMNTLS
jgi:hypothetical protein